MSSIPTQWNSEECDCGCSSLRLPLLSEKALGAVFRPLCYPSPCLGTPLALLMVAAEWRLHIKSSSLFLAVNFVWKTVSRSWEQRSLLPLQVYVLLAQVMLILCYSLMDALGISPKPQYPVPLFQSGNIADQGLWLLLGEYGMWLQHQTWSFKSRETKVPFCSSVLSPARHLPPCLVCMLFRMERALNTLELAERKEKRQIVCPYSCRHRQ